MSTFFNSHEHHLRATLFCSPRIGLQSNSTFCINRTWCVWFCSKTTNNKHSQSCFRKPFCRGRHPRRPVSAHSQINVTAHLSTKSNKRAAAPLHIKHYVLCKTTPTARVHIIRKETHSMRQSSNERLLWNVREITSSCCSLVSFTKFTA